MFQEEYRKAYDENQYRTGEIARTALQYRTKKYKKRMEMYETGPPCGSAVIVAVLVLHDGITAISGANSDGVSGNQTVCACFDGIYLA